MTGLLLQSAGNGDASSGVVEQSPKPPLKEQAIRNTKRDTQVEKQGTSDYLEVVIEV